MPNKTNILFFSHSAGNHGAEKSFITLLKHIGRSRFQPLVIIPAAGPMEQMLRDINIKYHIINMPRWINWEKKRFLEPLRVILDENKAVKNLTSLARDFKPDVIYTNTITNRTGARLAKKLNLPHIWHIREIIPNNPDLYTVFDLQKSLNYTLDNSNTIISISNAVTKQFSNTSDKIKVVYNYVDFPVSNIKIAKKDPFNLIYVGTIIKRKGIDTAIRAVSLLSKQIDIVLNIIGTQDKYVEELKQLCQSENISKNVNFINHVDNIHDYLDNSNVMLVPSHDEPWGRVVVEAMLTGLPVIGANAGGIPEIISDGTNGLLADPKDPNDWAEKITWVYNNYDKAVEIAQTAKQHAQKTYTIENYVGQIEKIIIKCLQ